MMSKGEKTPHVVIAAAKDDGQFKAVEVRKHEDALEVLWTKSLPAGDQTWTAFAAACGVTAGPDGHDKGTEEAYAVRGRARLDRRGLLSRDGPGGGVAGDGLDCPDAGRVAAAPAAGSDRGRLADDAVRRTATSISPSPPPGGSICTSSPAACTTSGPATSCCPARGRSRPGRACSPTTGQGHERP